MRYPDASSFRQALEQRLKDRAEGDGARLAGDRKRVAFDRLLARLVDTAPNLWVLKGGFVLDLRLAGRARVTRDIDIEWQAVEDELLDALIEAAAINTEDGFTFQIVRTGAPPERIGGGHRFRVIAELAGRLFETFVLDVALVPDLAGEVDTLTTPALLSFADIDPVAVPAVPLERHIAEKLHAYTRLYADERPSSRAKDLIDIILMSELAVFELDRLLEQIVRVFEMCGTHDLPPSVPRPPRDWDRTYRALAEEVGLDPDPAVGHRLVAAFLDPVLASESGPERWSPEALGWAHE